MLLLLLILSLALGQLGRLEIFPGIVIYVHDLLVILLLISYLPKTKTFSTPLTRPILAFTLTAIVSLLVAAWHFPPFQVLTGSLYLLRWLAYASVYLVVRQLKLPRSNLRFLTLTGLAVAITGLIQYFVIPDTRFLYDLGWDEHYYRLIGTFLDPNFTGIFLVLTLLLLWPSPLSLLPFAALLLTYSRSSYLAFVVVLIAALWRHHIRLLFVSCILFLVILFLLPRPGGEGVKLERLYSLTNRLDSMTTGLNIFQSAPVTGVGFNLLRFHQENPVSHSGAGIDNSFIFLLATTGIPGFLAYLWLLKKQLETKLIAYRLSLIAILVHSLLNNTLFYAPIMLWFWLLLALDR